MLEVICHWSMNFQVDYIGVKQLTDRSWFKWYKFMFSDLKCQTWIMNSKLPNSFLVFSVPLMKMHHFESFCGCRCIAIFIKRYRQASRPLRASVICSKNFVMMISCRWLVTFPVFCNKAGKSFPNTRLFIFWR